MAENKTLVFGDVVRDPSDDTLYVAVSGATALKVNKQFTLFLKLTDEYNCLCPQLFPYSRVSVRNFTFVKNIHSNIDSYLGALEIKHNKDIVKIHGFLCKIAKVPKK